MRRCIKSLLPKIRKSDNLYLSGHEYKSVGGIAMGKDLDLITRLLLISSAGLFIAGLIFVVLSIFKGAGNNWYLFAALLCTALAQLFQTIRHMHMKKKKE